VEIISYSEFDSCERVHHDILGNFILYNGNEIAVQTFKPSGEQVRHISLSPEWEKLLESHFSNFSNFNSKEICPYCNSFLVEYSADEIYQGVRGEENLFIYKKCSSCNFWIAFLRQYDIQIVKGKTAISYLKKYDATANNIPIPDLLKYLQRDSNTIKTIDPYRFEKIIQEYLKQEWKDAEVIHVGKPGDGGVDILLIISDNERWLVQCKRRSKTGYVEGVETIRKLLGAMIENDNLNGIVVTTADKFSPAAISLASSDILRKFGLKVKLTDYGILKEIIPNLNVKDPWASFFK